MDKESSQTTALTDSKQREWFTPLVVLIRPTLQVNAQASVKHVRPRALITYDSADKAFSLKLPIGLATAIAMELRTSGPVVGINLAILTIKTFTLSSTTNHAGVPNKMRRSPSALHQRYQMSRI